jgi:hypothetical protein
MWRDDIDMRMIGGVDPARRVARASFTLFPLLSSVRDRMRNSMARILATRFHDRSDEREG